MIWLLLLAGFAWAIRIFLNILAYTSLWYLKEYRFDRMLIHLRSPEGKKIFFPPLRRPPIAPKTVVLVGLMTCITASVLLFVPGPFLFKLVTIDLLTFPVLSLLVLLLKIPTFIYHMLLIRMAVAKLRHHAPMTVIGITGSYGKTSTKEMLAQVLSARYTVLKTEASKNSPIAIAELVLRYLTPDHQVFIVEMGAYKKGEIKEMCSMVRPNIGIITAINAQHQDLFGSIENTMHAKYELVQGLGENGVAIMNFDNEMVQKMAAWAKRDGMRVVGYSTADISLKEILYRGISAHQENEALSFTLMHKKEKHSVTIHLLGLHHVSNMLAVIAAGCETGMSVREVIRACSGITHISRTMVPQKGIHGSIFIDDTFNNNPDAAKAALSFLGTKKGKTVMVFQPMIELGKYAQTSHDEVAKFASESISEIILTNDSYYESFEKFKTKIDVHVLSASEAADHLRKTIKQGDTVLFKGKQAAAVLQLLV